MINKRTPLDSVNLRRSSQSSELRRQYGLAQSLPNFEGEHPGGGIWLTTSFTLPSTSREDLGLDDYLAAIFYQITEAHGSPIVTTASSQSAPSLLEELSQIPTQKAIFINREKRKNAARQRTCAEGPASPKRVCNGSRREGTPPSPPPSVLTFPVLFREGFSLNSLTLYTSFVFAVWIVFPISTTCRPALSWTGSRKEGILSSHYPPLVDPPCPGRTIVKKGYWYGLVTLVHLLPYGSDIQPAAHRAFLSGPVMVHCSEKFTYLRTLY
ncbi:hypothetical protein TNCV_1787711 [Trichonephila clavipes]|nr:hypothetical protein TNCV_1787711 [Trichonephila clavipes]